MSCQSLLVIVKEVQVDIGWDSLYGRPGISCIVVCLLEAPPCRELDTCEFLRHFTVAGGRVGYKLKVSRAF